MKTLNKKKYENYRMKNKFEISKISKKKKE
jgi:hypothetical protein